MRVKTGWMNIDKATLYFEIEGEGPTIVLIHGHSVDCRMWNSQMKELVKDFRILRYDLRGYGHSSLPTEGVDFLHAHDLYQLISKLNIENVHLVGLSLGSFVALDFLALYPELVHSVSLASGAIYADENDLDTRKQPPLVTDIDGFKRKWIEQLLKGCGPLRERYEGDLRRMIGDWSAWQVTHREPESLLRFKLNDILLNLNIDIPICVFFAEDDFEGAHRSSSKLIDIIPQAKRIDLPHAGHFSNMETPEMFNSALLEFLRGEQVSSRSPNH